MSSALGRYPRRLALVGRPGKTRRGQVGQDLVARLLQLAALTTAAVLLGAVAGLALYANAHAERV